MSAKKWLFFSILIIFIGLSGITYALYWTDPYSIAHPARTRYHGEPNRNFLKVNYILTHPDSYDSFIFGSSKVGAIRASAIPVGHFYNMTYSAGIPHEHLLNIKLFLRSGIKIKNLLLGLEEASYLEPFSKHQQQGLTKAHPLASGESWFDFYRFYFFHVPSKHEKSLFFMQLKSSEPLYSMDVFNQKAYYDHLAETSHPRDPHDPIFSKPAEFHGNNLANAMKDLKEIVLLAKTHDINLTVFINPIHHTTYDAMDPVLFQTFKTSLAGLTPYYDFSGPNAYTQNNLFWSDTTHYDFSIGQKMIDIIYSGVHTPTDLGTFVEQLITEP